MAFPLSSVPDICNVILEDVLLAVDNKLNSSHKIAEALEVSVFEFLDLEIKSVNDIIISC